MTKAEKHPDWAAFCKTINRLSREPVDRKLKLLLWRRRVLRPLFYWSMLSHSGLSAVALADLLGIKNVGSLIDRLYKSPYVGSFYCRDTDLQLFRQRFYGVKYPSSFTEPAYYDVDTTSHWGRNIAKSEFSEQRIQSIKPDVGRTYKGRDSYYAPAIPRTTWIAMRRFTDYGKDEEAPTTRREKTPRTPAPVRRKGRTAESATRGAR